MKVLDFYGIIKLNAPSCGEAYFEDPITNSQVGGEFCFLDNNGIPEGYEWLYDFDYCENKNYLFRFNTTYEYNPSGSDYSVSSTYGWIIDKEQNKIVSSTISEKVCNPGGCETTSGNIKACKIPKIVTVDKANFYYK